MKYDNIKVGDILELSPGRSEAYGIAYRQITVMALQARPGYKVGFVVAKPDAGAEAFGPNKDKWFFKPSDFSRKV